VIWYDVERRLLHYGERSIPAADRGREDVDLSGPGLGVFHHRRCGVAFESGWMLSILWGDATYSDNHDSIFGVAFREIVERVEVGVLDPSGALVNDEPYGYVDEQQLAALITITSKLGTRDRWPLDEIPR
jgi:hypothetical protein